MNYLLISEQIIKKLCNTSHNTFNPYYEGHEKHSAKFSQFTKYDKGLTEKIPAFTKSIEEK